MRSAEISSSLYSRRGGGGVGGGWGRVEEIGYVFGCIFLQIFEQFSSTPIPPFLPSRQEGGVGGVGGGWCVLR